MTRHADAIGRAYERLGRERKAARIAARVPFGQSDERNEWMLKRLADATPEERAQFAADAGCNPPSDETWRRVVEIVRERIITPANNVGADPADHITSGRGP